MNLHGDECHRLRAGGLSFTNGKGHLPVTQSSIRLNKSVLSCLEEKILANVRRNSAGMMACVFSA